MISSVRANVFPSNLGIISVKDIVILHEFVTEYILNVYLIQACLGEDLLSLIGGGYELTVKVNLVSHYLILSAIADKLYLLILGFLDLTLKICTANLCRYGVTISRTVCHDDIIGSVLELYGCGIKIVCGINSHKRKIGHLVDSNVRKSIVFRRVNASYNEILRSYIEDLNGINGNISEISFVIHIGEGYLGNFLINVDRKDGNSSLSYLSDVVNTGCCQNVNKGFAFFHSEICPLELAAIVVFIIGHILEDRVLGNNEVSYDGILGVILCTLFANVNVALINVFVCREGYLNAPYVAAHRLL